MRILICDDDKIIVSSLRKNLEDGLKKFNVTDYEIVEYNLGEDLLKDEGDKDIVFLDIEMPGQDGIYVGSELKQSNPKAIVIIITSFSEYLDEAMRFSVFRYLSKPIDKNRLFRNLKDAVEVYNRISVNYVIDFDGKSIKIDSDDIIMVESEGRKLQMITEKQTYILNGSMQEWSEKLNLPSFYMCHRSYIVNIKHVTSIDKDMIYLEDGKYQAYLSKRKYVEMKKRFMLFVEKNI